MEQDKPSAVDRMDDLWEGADALLVDLRQVQTTDVHAAKMLGQVIASLEVVADAGRRAASAMQRYNHQLIRKE